MVKDNFPTFSYGSRNLSEYFSVFAFGRYSDLPAVLQIFLLKGF
jgi:hypothetical protein